MSPAELGINDVCVFACVCMCVLVRSAALRKCMRGHESFLCMWHGSFQQDLLRRDERRDKSLAQSGNGAWAPASSLGSRGVCFLYHRVSDFFFHFV